MAKINNSTTFEHCTVDLESMQILEYTKEKGELILTEVHDIMKVLEKFNKIDDLTISIKKNTNGIEFK